MIADDRWVLIKTSRQELYVACTDSTLGTDLVEHARILQAERRARALREQELRTYVIPATPTPEPDPVIYDWRPPRWPIERLDKRGDRHAYPKIHQHLTAHQRRGPFKKEARRPANAGRPSSWKTFKRRMARGTLHKERHRR